MDVVRFAGWMLVGAGLLVGCGGDEGPCGADADPTTRPEAPDYVVVSRLDAVVHEGRSFVAENLEDWVEATFTVPDGTVCLGWMEATGGHRIVASGTTLYTATRPAGSSGWRAHVVEGGVSIDQGFLVVNTDTTLGNRAVRLADNYVLAVDFVPLDAAYASGVSLVLAGQSMPYIVTVAAYRRPDNTWELGAALYQSSDNLRLTRGRLALELSATATPVVTAEVDAESGLPLVSLDVDGDVTQYLYDPGENAFVEVAR